MEKKIVASILSEGNNTFQSSITIEDTGLKVRIPGLWKTDETRIAYDQIAGVTKHTPVLGFSSIEFNAMGKQVKIHGFTKDEVIEIDKAITLGKRGLLITNSSNIVAENTATSPGAVSEIETFAYTIVKAYAWIWNTLFEMLQSFAALFSKSPVVDTNAESELYEDIINIENIRFSNDTLEIIDQLEDLLSSVHYNDGKKIYAARFKKIELGIVKLKSMNATAAANHFEKKLQALKWKHVLDM